MEQEAFVDNSPHFVDEQSLRGAQPVVPLAEISSGNTKRKFVIALALLLAVGLGAGVALLIVSLRQPVGVQSSVTPRPAKTTKAEDPAVAAADDEEEMLDLSEGEDAEVIVTEAARASDEKPPQKRFARTVSRTSGSGNEIRTTENEQRQAIAPVQNDEAPKPVLVEQWEEKRSRRATRLNERDRANARRPDLFRIREIFEGARP